MKYVYIPFLLFVAIIYSQYTSNFFNKEKVAKSKNIQKIQRLPASLDGNDIKKCEYDKWIKKIF